MPVFYAYISLKSDYLPVCCWADFFEMIPRLAKRAANAAGKGIILKYLEFLTNYSKNSSKLKVVYVLTLRVS